MSTSHETPYIINQCGHGPHDTAWWAAGWTSMVQIIFKHEITLHVFFYCI